MQTFLPFSSFRESASVLDRQRLGKQRVEVFQILKALNGESKGWTNHPCTNMWRGYEKSLVLYGTSITREWKSRGYKDSMELRIGEYFYKFDQEMARPPWLGDEDFHRSHQSNLIRKNPEHYGPLFRGVPDDLEYIWPVLSV